MRRSVLASFSILALLPAVIAVGSPSGFASGTTGGAGGTTVTPTTTAELLTYLSDSTARTIILNKIFDFTSYYGTSTGKVCSPWTCTDGFTPQRAIDLINWCDPSAPTGTATYYNSGTANYYSLKVGSNKTILGQGSGGGIKGIGLYINDATNVIVQNIQITDINPSFVWGGDAISIIGSSKVWIDHNYIARVGRQFVVTGFDPAQSVTISNNLFDGTTSWSASCNNQHYWVMLFAGRSDTITVAQNYIKNTSGRGPHIGYDGGYQYVHLVNNYYENVQGHAIDAAAGTQVLVEGNYFNKVTTIDTGNADGSEYFVATVDQAGTPCSSTIGRYCEWNKSAGSGAIPNRASTSVMTALKAYSAVKGYTPKSVNDVQAYVIANAGVGKVN